jgi:hypothetical protein
LDSRPLCWLIRPPVSTCAPWFVCRQRLNGSTPCGEEGLRRAAALLEGRHRNSGRPWGRRRPWGRHAVVAAMMVVIVILQPVETASDPVRFHVPDTSTGDLGAVGVDEQAESTNAIPSAIATLRMGVVDFNVTSGLQTFSAQPVKSVGRSARSRGADSSTLQTQILRQSRSIAFVLSERQPRVHAG